MSQKLLTEEIKKYLENRYDDFNSYIETLWRIKLGYDNIPLCPICGKNQLKFYGSSQIGFNQTCSKECQHKLWHKNQMNTVYSLYGKNNYYATEECKKKIKNTCLEKYGYDCTLKVPEVRKKIEQTCLQKYGCTNGGGSEYAIQKIKNTCRSKYGVDNPWQIPEVIDHIKEVQRSNKKHNIYKGIKFDSKEEMECFKILEFHFKDIKCHYKSELYPYFCDFYIPEKDLYIEYNGFFSHGTHAFDETNEEDQALLNKLKQKDDHISNYFIENWTIYDPKKRKCAKDNNLNYLEFFNFKQFKEYFESE